MSYDSYIVRPVRIDIIVVQASYVYDGVWPVARMLDQKTGHFFELFFMTPCGSTSKMKLGRQKIRLVRVLWRKLWHFEILVENVKECMEFLTTLKFASQYKHTYHTFIPNPNVQQVKWTVHPINAAGKWHCATLICSRGNGQCTQ